MKPLRQPVDERDRRLQRAKFEALLEKVPLEEAEIALRQLLAARVPAGPKPTKS